MIDRYTLPEMGRIWSQENKLQNWLKIEIAACEAQARLGNIPAEALAAIKARAAYDPARIEQIEVVRHAKVRRAQLYYMRERRGKSARLKERRF